MSRRSSSMRVCFSPDYESQQQQSVFLKHSTSVGGGERVAATGRRSGIGAGAWGFRRSRSSSSTGACSPAKFLRRLGAKLARTLRTASLRKRSSRKFSSSASSLARSRSVSADPLDSQRLEAVEDCIEFLHSSSMNSSASFSRRSSSATACS